MHFSLENFIGGQAHCTIIYMFCGSLTSFKSHSLREYPSSINVARTSMRTEIIASGYGLDFSIPMSSSNKLFLVSTRSSIICSANLIVATAKSPTVHFLNNCFQDVFIHIIAIVKYIL